jgi:hypothetical protein
MLKLSNNFFFFCILCSSLLKGTHDSCITEYTLSYLNAMQNDEVEVDYVTGSVFHSEMHCDLNAVTIAVET